MMTTAMDSLWEEKKNNPATRKAELPEGPLEPMEFLSRSWSASALQVCKALIAAPQTPRLHPKITTNSASASASANNINVINTTPENISATGDVNINIGEPTKLLSGNPFSFASCATSQLVLERIMSQSEISPLTSGRLSHSSGPLNGSLTEETDSPPISPSHEYDDVVKYLRANNSLQPLFTGGRNGSYAGGGGNTTPGGKTVGRWLKERREKKKEETRAHNAQIHAAVSVAAMAAAVATIAAGTSSSSASKKDEQTAKINMAVASAAALVAAQCVESAESLGADREYLLSAITSAVNVRSHGDIATLTAAAATALRGVATLKARALKEVWNIGAVIPGDRGLNNVENVHTNNRNGRDQPGSEEDFLSVCNQEFLARGSELLKRTRQGDLHWKIVSVYIHRSGEVMLKMKSKHVAGTITKKKKNVVLEVCKDMPAWPGRHLFEDGEQRRYFGLNTTLRGLVEFECKSQREYDIWTQGVSRLLTLVAQKKHRHIPKSLS